MLKNDERLTFEETEEFMSLVEDMNRRIEAELRAMLSEIRAWERGMHMRMPPQIARLKEQKCMERQTAISIETRRKIAERKAVYEGGSDE